MTPLLEVYEVRKGYRIRRGHTDDMRLFADYVYSTFNELIDNVGWNVDALIPMSKIYSAESKAIMAMDEMIVKWNV